VSYEIIAAQGTATVTLTANQKIAVKTAGEALVYQVVGFPNYPSQNDLIQTVTDTIYTSSAFTNGATIIIEAGAYPVLYAVGTNPVVGDDGDWQKQGGPSNIPDGGSMAMTAATILSGIVTATPTQARNVQLPTAADIIAATQIDIDESFDWSLITLAAFALTITSNTGSTTGGLTATGSTAGSAARFRTRRDSATTVVTYRLA
jgi:hypothetical protein